MSGSEMGFKTLVMLSLSLLLPHSVGLNDQVE